MIRLLIHNFKIATEAIFQNKLRSLLTSLGIIFGVASVIAMLAIGKGAEQEILDKMKLLGTNNIIINPLTTKAMEEKKDEESGETEVEDQTKTKKQRYSPGLTLLDAESIKSILPEVHETSPEIVMETIALRRGLKLDVKLVGIQPSYFEVNPFELIEGTYFLEHQIKNAEPVCIIGEQVKKKLFARGDAVGKKVKCGNQWLTVVGIFKERDISEENIDFLELRNFNLDIYTPANTMLVRFINRAKITEEDLARRRRGRDQADPNVNYHQLDKLVVRVENTEKMRYTADVIKRMLLRRHNGVEDFEVIVPELLLQQEQQTRDIFNIVLGSIASISLIVGGIGIMNIMLASVMERIREIGVRLAVGARQSDIMQQFLSEAIAISLTGGIFGIILGFVLSYLIEQFTGINTIVSPFSVGLSFIVSISVGIVFGLMPARRAAKQDPIQSLRYE